MLRRLLWVGIVLVFLAPAAGLIGVGVVMSPAAATTACQPGTLQVGPVPGTLTATTNKTGATITLDKTQLVHAATIATIGGQIPGVGRAGVLVALMAALTESGLRQLANTSAYPASATYPNDGNGSDHDSLGLFQMRPQAGWGTVAQLMDPTYQARAFYGGPTGPNHGSPRGLLDIPGWAQLDPGQAAQAVEVSAYPDRYQNYRPVAEAILATLTQPNPTSGGGVPVVAETSRVVFPLPDGTWVKSSPFGWRTDPITGQRSFHSGTDFAAPAGTPILAVADGRVVQASYTDTTGGIIVIEHTIGGQPVASVYIHMWATGIHVAAGQTVTAGQHIGDVGSAGRSTGAHLHLEIHPGGPAAPPVDPDVWLTTHHAHTTQPGTPTPATCTLGGTA